MLFGRITDPPTWKSYLEYIRSEFTSNKITSISIFCNPRSCILQYHYKPTESKTWGPRTSAEFFRKNWHKEGDKWGCGEQRITTMALLSHGLESGSRGAEGSSAEKLISVQHNVSLNETQCSWKQRPSCFYHVYSERVNDLGKWVSEAADSQVRTSQSSS